MSPKHIVVIYLFMIRLVQSFSNIQRASKPATNHQRFKEKLSTRLMSLSNKDKLVIIVAGPTGVGKSAVAAQLCEKNSGIIVSADSVQAYRGVNIGANKPTPEERKCTPHLLVDVVSSKEQYNAAEWTRDALSCIDLLLKKENRDTERPEMAKLESDIMHAKNIKGYDLDSRNLPVVVGGTMMYLQWLVYGRPDAVQPSKKAVEKAYNMAEQFKKNELGGWEEAVRHVSSLNAIFEDRVKKFAENDWYRLTRTMEIAYTALDQDDPICIEKLFSGERQGGLESLGYDVRCFFLCPSDRMEHTSIVDERCEDMIVRGLLQETAELEISNDLPLMATKAIGYRQVLEYLTRENAKLKDEEAFENFLNNFTTATRRYAKQQMAWFRKDRKFVFVPVTIGETNRVSVAANRIQELCEASRQDYEESLLEKDGEGNIPESYQARLRNQEQAAKMKYYQFKRYQLEKGSPAFKSLLEIADECTEKIRISQQSKEDSFPSLKKQRLL